MRSLIIATPLLLLLVLFALSNTAPARLTLWPTDYALVLPLSLAILSGMALAFICGALLVWTSSLGQRRRARRAEQAVRLLEAQVQALKERVGSPVLPPPAA
jgi:lipopolysaccharide assembly protein A